METCRRRIYEEKFEGEVRWEGRMTGGVEGEEKAGEMEIFCCLFMAGL